MTADTFAPWPEPHHVRVLRAKVEAVEALALKHKLHGDGRIPVCQILNAFIEIEERP